MSSLPLFPAYDKLRIREAVILTTMIDMKMGIDDVIDMGSSSVGSSVGTGGMHTKLIAGKIATLSGADMVIANSKDLSIIHNILDANFKGTVFKSNYDEFFDVLGYIEDNYNY